MKTRPLCLLGVLLASACSAAAADLILHSFKKQQLDKYYWSEGAMFGDLNQDGKPDAVSGPYWWEGPAFTKRHEIYSPRQVTKTKKDGKDVEFPGFEGNFGSKNAYSTDNFFAFVHDLNGDGWNDVLTYGLPNTPAYLYLNPKGSEQHWERHTVLDHVDNESPTFTDLTGDGKPEIICCYEGNFGYATPDWSNPTAKWTFHPITPKGNWQRFTHGLGVGDLNGDRRLDILFKDGWFEQPAKAGQASRLPSQSKADGGAGETPALPWKLHKANFAPASAQMYAYDVNGDGRADVITALAAHGYGLAWHEQLAEKDPDGSPKWRSHVFMHKAPEENRYGIHFPELHAVEFFDVDGDGLKDIITGNCYWAHGPAVSPGPGEEGVLYWFKLVRNPDMSVDWVPHLIDTDSGVGRQIGTGDLNGDGLQDLIIGNKLGTFVFAHEAKKVSQEAWAKAQPPVKFPTGGDQRLESMSVIVHTMRPSGTPAVVQPPTKKGASVPSGAASPYAKREGIIPVGKDGQALNLAFESGSLQDWSGTGTAFGKQPIQGDTVAKRLAGTGRSDRSQHEGGYWVGGYEAGGDNLTGTLTSVPFKVTHPFASFLVGGGSHAATRVELVRADTQEVIFTARGANKENLRPVGFELRPHVGKEIFIRIVDEQKGPWGHINFDDFRFHAEKPVFAGTAGVPPAVTPKAAAGKKRAGGTPAVPASLPPVDDFKFAGLKPEEAAREMTLPPGFKAHVFAAEPDVRNPIAFCLDDRGRVWVVEGITYPQRAPEGQGKDRILVFEDTNGDHKFDRRTVFMEGLNLVSGIEYGFGGVWVGAAPNLLFIPIADGDAPKPAGQPEILLEGWGYQDTHETLNTFRWGPDGWLYGCHGVFTHSHVKPSGEPDSARQAINAGVWRYHPQRKEFEVFAEGTSNPWGMDFDERGQLFMEGCVIPHLWHMIQGARYHRQSGQHYLASREETLRNDPDYFKQDFGVRAPRLPLQQFIYDDIKTIADHVHYAGVTPHGGNGRSASAGGGHAHAGLMCYLGGSWPEEYRGKLFMNNIHGGRMNMDIPERAGSGFTGHHGADFLVANDKASQMMDMRYDQDGSVYVMDWYDVNQCHRPDRAVHDYDTGRIFKVVYGGTKTTKVDLQKASDEELVGYLSHKNAWLAQHARRNLQERANARKLSASILPQIYTRLSEGERGRSPNLNSRLNLFWTLHTCGLTATECDYFNQLGSESEYLRAWAIQLECEGRHPGSTSLTKYAKMAASDPSPIVRLYLASALQRLPVEQRWDILVGLLAHSEDVTDHNLPLMYWYALEPVLAADPSKAAQVFKSTQIPILREFAARRLTTASQQTAGGQE